MEKIILYFFGMVLLSCGTKLQAQAVPDAEKVMDAKGFVYGTVMAADGRVWLNNNLGANYANPSHSDFNPTQQAANVSDPNAYGDLFQWGRKADGHERIRRKPSKSIALFGTATKRNDFPTDGLFIITKGDDWRSRPDNTDLWTTANGIHNPCPSGFRVPTLQEWEAMMAASSITSLATAHESILKLCGGGFRDAKSGSIRWVRDGLYWTSTSSFPKAAQIWLDASVHKGDVSRAFGNAVRCIQD